MEESEIITPKRVVGGVRTGFRISNEPLVESQRAPEQLTAETGETPAGSLEIFGDDTLYVLARDPKTLFIYWDIDLTRRLTQAGLTERGLHSRVLRNDGSEEAVKRIDPMVGYTFVDVSAPGARYTCELGCFEESVWTTLARSGPTETPEAAVSDDIDAEFATLPFHLSFQRLIDIFRASPTDPKTLTESVAGMQSKAAALRASISEADWTKVVGAAVASVDAEAGFGLSGVPRSEFAALLRTVTCDSSRRVPSPEKLARWRQLGENVGGSSWGGTSWIGGWSSDSPLLHR